MFRTKTRDWVVFLNIGERSVQLYMQTDIQLSTSAIRTKPPLGNHYHDERFLPINETALKLNK